MRICSSSPRKLIHAHGTHPEGSSPSTFPSELPLTWTVLLLAIRNLTILQSLSYYSRFQISFTRFFVVVAFWRSQGNWKREGRFPLTSTILEDFFIGHKASTKQRESDNLLIQAQLRSGKFQHYILSPGSSKSCRYQPCSPPNKGAEGLMSSGPGPVCCPFLFHSYTITSNFCSVPWGFH